MDQEYIYPYWDDIINAKGHKNLQINFDAMSPFAEINLDVTIWNQLRQYEQAARLTRNSKFAAVCGRYYEARFIDAYGIGSLLEGAPIDGAVPDVPGHHIRSRKPHWLMNPHSGFTRPIYFEMKKMRYSTRRCYFNYRNVAAITKYNGVYIGATIHPTLPKIIYRFALP